ncbi:carboxypeptidase B [Eurytemora carolleeae]|uniref:carboxypeptidase B n=1 Tax=Eurytemora carolleeae TaxID=1294199 RepID=UPI000C78E59E|nr:carboxypeptidase B [Eurytemora carolleeae]|eukprot:XP_023343756.1 carboxypeptidase B-like [Eurytemora affinis]
MNWNNFHSYEVLDRWMECLAVKFGSKVELIKIGQSSEGRVLKVAHVKLGGNSTQSVFVDGGMHAREWASPASVSFILHKLVETSELDHLLNKYDIFILPLANPDGYMYSRDHDRMWRKTRSRTGQSSLFGQECFGVDPNRNFGYRWGGHGASDNACKVS